MNDIVLLSRNAVERDFIAQAYSLCQIYIAEYMTSVTKETKSKHPLLLFLSISIGIIILLLVSSNIHLGGVRGETLITVSFFAAFAGGFLSLISPCSAAMLPVFFAYSFKEKSELVRMTCIFYLGLASIFVPLGFASTAIASLFIGRPGILFTTAGTLFILFGIMLLFGKSFRILPERFTGLATGKKGAGLVYVMGILYAFASGTCAAPIIGGIFTIAATSSNVVHSIALLLVYALGMVGPLFIMAFFFDTYDFANSRLLRGILWEVRVKNRTLYFHSTNLIAAVLFIGVGILFIVSKGTNALLAVFAAYGLTDIYFRLNVALLHSSSLWPMLLMIVVVSSIAGFVLRRRKKFQKEIMKQ